MLFSRDTVMMYTATSTNSRDKILNQVLNDIKKEKKSLQLVSFEDEASEELRKESGEMKEEKTADIDGGDSNYISYEISNEKRWDSLTEIIINTI